MPDLSPGGNPTPITLYDEAGNKVALLSAAPGSDTGQVAIPVRVISQLGAGGAGSTVTPADAEAAQAGSPTVAQLMGFNGTTWDRVRTMTAGTIPGVVQVNIAGTSGLTPVSSGTISAVSPTYTAASTVANSNVGSAGNATIVIVGGAGTNMQFTFEAAGPDGNFFPIDAVRADGADAAMNSAGTKPTTWVAGQVSAYQLMLAAPTQVRVRAIAGTLTANFTAYIYAGPFLADFSPMTRDFLAGTGLRTIFTAQYSGTPATTEALLSLTPYRSAVAGTAATSQPVTANRTLRIQSMSLSVQNSATTAAGARAVLRYASSGSVSTSSPMIDSIAVSAANAIANGMGSVNISFGSDGVEFPSGYQFGVSLVGVATGTAVVVLKGYEYA